MSAALAVAIPQQRRAPLRVLPGGRPSLDSPFELRRGMAKRLHGAVRAVVEIEAPAGTRLLRAVVFAHASGDNEFVATFRSIKHLPDLLGVTADHVRRILNVAEGAGHIGFEERLNEYGDVTGYDVWVPEQRAAYAERDRRSPLWLHRKELGLLQALTAALLAAPDVAHGRSAGLLQGIAGRGATLRRLGGLLAVLSAHASGRITLGRPKGRERGLTAAWFAARLGVGIDTGRAVRDALVDEGLLELHRVVTENGLTGRDELYVIPVREAQRRSRRRNGGLPENAAAVNQPVASEVVAGQQVAQDERHCDSGLPGNAALTHVHTPVVAPVVEVAAEYGLSAAGALGLTTIGVPREESTQDGALRAEKPETAPNWTRLHSGLGDGVDAVLAAAAPLWWRMSRGQRHVVQHAVVQALLGPVDAEHLAAQVGQRYLDAGPVVDPVGWLLGRGLAEWDAPCTCDPREPWYVCPACKASSARTEERRAQRTLAAVQVKAEMPYASPADRRREAGRRVHQQVNARSAYASQVRPIGIPCTECGTAVSPTSVTRLCLDCLPPEAAADHAPLRLLPAPAAPPAGADDARGAVRAALFARRGHTETEQAAITRAREEQRAQRLELDAKRRRGEL
ncbi:hypothetical protein M8Z33_07355 [Streptomyces sp. ZAF1911]|uniref:hypothetical protein n=1 Tax=Streptomyces sp. ZAF1911 TaxID=2944129 RepID=UPI00237B9472|nr:hypothetical protein [Streptomyces sp. ZAF1911]MDD9376490.1 hypothetical protein [Streptomyces sp. ZAF1911]